MPIKHTTVMAMVIMGVIVYGKAHSYTTDTGADS